MGRALSVAVLCSAAILVPADPAAACSCGPPPVCSAYWDADRVFIGRAEVTPLGPGAQRARFRIEESFRGPSGVIDIEARGIGGSCAYAFVDGTRYLVFARQDEGSKWRASFCSHTAPLDQAAEDLAFARNIARDSRGGGRVYGSAVIGERDARGIVVGTMPLGGASVTLRDGARVLTAETNLLGIYEFNAVPPARYTLSIRVTPQFEPAPATTVNVKGPGACVVHSFTPIRKAVQRE